LFLGGWYDCFSQGTIDGFVAFQTSGQAAARGKCRLVMGPWAHGAIKELKYPENSRIPKAADQWKWFDHYLKGENNGLEDEPAVYYYVMGDPEDKDAPGNEWRSAESWPPKSLPSCYYLQSDGALTFDAPSVEASSRSFTYDPKNPVPTVGGANLTLAVGPMDQRSVEARPDVLVFTTAAMDIVHSD
jgi:putative CocE/NonD family hydrolase